MKTQGEIEAAICEGISRFERDYMGRGPKDVHAHLIGDLLVVRLQGVLTAAEQQLVKLLPSEKGRDLLKQVRTHLIETARPVMEEMVRNVTGTKVLSLHHVILSPTHHQEPRGLMGVVLLLVIGYLSCSKGIQAAAWAKKAVWINNLITSFILLFPR